MYNIKIQQEDHHQVIATKVYDLFLTVLRNAGYDIYAPCGGNGTCGKC